MLEMLSSNENNSGELPASEEELHALFDRIVFYVEQHCKRDESLQIYDDILQQEARELTEYLQDPTGTTAKLQKQGETEKLAYLEEFGRDLINDTNNFVNFDNTDQDKKYWANEATNPDRPAYFELQINDPKMLKETGIPEEILGVDIFVVDNTLNPTEIYADRVIVSFLYKQDWDNLNSSTNRSKILHHDLTFEHIRSNDYNEPDGYSFYRIYRDDRSGHKIMPESELIDNLELEEQLGIHKVQRQEVEWLNNLLNLHSQIGTQ